MKKLTKEEMSNVYASGLSAAGIGAIIGSFIAFVVGAIDGYTRPFKCR